MTRTCDLVINSHPLYQLSYRGRVAKSYRIPAPFVKSPSQTRLAAPPFLMDRFLLVCLGGAVGSGARYLLSGWVLRQLSTAFPWGTLSVNLLGSFFLALLMSLGLSGLISSPELRLALTTGAMGGFTTYSTFSYETAVLIQEGSWATAGLNTAVTIIVCLLAAVLGLAAGRALGR